MKQYLVEHYWPGVTVEQFAAATKRVSAQAKDMTRAGRLIRYVHSTMVPGDEAGFCFFEADSDELVKQAYEAAGVQYERIVDALEFGADPAVKGRRQLNGYEQRRLR